VERASILLPQKLCIPLRILLKLGVIQLCSRWALNATSA